MEDTPDLIDISKINEIIKTEPKSDLKESDENAEYGSQPLCDLKISNNEIKVEKLSNDVVFEAYNPNDNTENALYNNLDAVNEGDSVEEVNMKSELDSDNIDDPGPSSFSFDHEVFGNSTRGRRRNPDKHKCNFCGTVFPRKIKLDAHLLKVHSDQETFMDFISFKIHECTTCVDFKTIYKHQYLEHMISKHGVQDQTRQFVCPKCGKKVLRKSNLKRHMRIHDENDGEEDDAGDVSREAAHIKNEVEAVKSEPMEEDNTNDSVSAPNNVEPFGITTYRGKSKYQCNFCFTLYGKKQDLDHHLLHGHPNEDVTSYISSKIYTCSICPNYKTLYAFQYEDHVAVTHKEGVKSSKELKCSKCDYVTTKKTYFKIHMEVHSNGPASVGRYPCAFCQMSFSNKHSLDCHYLHGHPNEDISSVISSKIYVCSICPKFKTIFNYQLKQHMNITHRADPEQKELECAECGHKTMWKTNMIRHVQAHRIEKLDKQHVGSFDCKYCESKFEGRLLLEEHLLDKHSTEDIADLILSRIHKCKICKNYKTVFKKNYLEHVKAHKEHKPREVLHCEHCEYETVFKTYLDRHIKSHFYQKQHPCTLCKVTFNKKQALDHHILKYHDNDKTLTKTITYNLQKCDKCPYSTTRLSFLEKHIKRIHVDKLPPRTNEHICVFCSKVFAIKIKLDSHLLSVHTSEDLAGLVTSKMYSCDICLNYKTVYKTKFTKHMSVNHEQGEDQEEFQCTQCTFKTVKKINLTKHMKRHLEATGTT